MDSLTFVVKLVEHAAWPVTVVIACTLLIIACVVFKKSIESLLGRLNKAQYKGVAAEFTADTQKTTSKIEGDTNTSIAYALPEDQFGLITKVSEFILRSNKAI